MFKELAQRGYDSEGLWNGIKDIAVKTIILSYEQIKHNYLTSQPEDYHNRMLFHVLGLDILVDEFMSPVLLEVNHTPSFATDTPLDWKIKHALVKDTLQLMRCHHTNLK